MIDAQQWEDGVVALAVEARERHVELEAGRRVPDDLLMSRP